MALCLEPRPQRDGELPLVSPTLRIKNAVPERVTARGSNALRLRLTNGKDVYLLNKDGKVTEYGRYWYDEVKDEAHPRTQFDPNARLVKKIRTDYIRTMDGKEKAVRTWKPQLAHTRTLHWDASTSCRGLDNT